MNGYSILSIHQSWLFFQNKYDDAYPSILIIDSSRSPIVFSFIELKPELVFTTAPVLSPPAPVVDFDIDIGEIITAPPKFTIPPETVPILTPS
jgi:hypothetical protein